MKIGISTASFFSKELTEASFNVIKKLGIDTVEVFLSTFSEYKPEFVDGLLSIKDNIDVYSVHTLNQQFEPELFNPMPRTRGDSETIFKQVCEDAGRLGAKCYTFHGPAKFKRIKYVLDYARIGTRVQELCEFVKKHSNGKTEFTYETVHWTYYNEPDYIAKLSPYTDCKVCLDIKQIMQSGFDVYEYLKFIGNKLANVHLCDYNENDQLALPGKGSFDFVRFFRYLNDNGYTGPAMIEVYANNYSSYDELARSYDYLNECLYKAIH